MSRRAELTAELISTIELSTRKGHWPKVAARKLGIHANTFDGWMKRGEAAHLNDSANSDADPDFLCRQLYEKIEEAEAEAEIYMLNQAITLAELGKTSWNGFVTMMERRFSDRWRKRDALMGDVSDSWEAQVKKDLLAKQNDAAVKPQLRAIE
jgi:hypothetical protein